ncbi:Centrosomal protein kizuna [Tupaia chinensis]|uniref:Centrosomal protein kizuna n=1 Tax=Tupaia chinensis TaxID=246437 RepID=L8YD68_TUPCH|nr:Centrosomal protein kizuna [Tupaia chinensis]
MHQTPASSVPLASPDYYERLGHLQQGLRDRVKLRYVKLKKYLKEICESEKKARTRNQDYLKRFEHVQVHVGRFTTNTEKLQELKIATQAGINAGTAVSRGLYQPATIFMGHQVSAISSIGDLSTEQKSPQPTKNFSIPDPHSYRQTAQSSDVTDSYVVQTSSDTQCLNKSDKLDGKTSLQIGEKTPVRAGVLSEEEQTHCLEIGSSTRHGKSNLSEGKKSAELHSPLQGRLSPENRTTDLKCDSSSRSEEEILTREHIEVEEERARPPVSAVSVSEDGASGNKWSQEKRAAGEGFSDRLAHGDPESQGLFRKTQEEQEEESESSSSDLTVSVSEDDLMLRSPEPQPSPGDMVEAEDGAEASRPIRAEQERGVLSTERNLCLLQTSSSPDSRKESGTNTPTEELAQAPDSDLLRARLGPHPAALENHNSLKEEATAFSRQALPEECADGSALYSDESSCSLPSFLNDSGRKKGAEPALWLSGAHAGEREVSSDCRQESNEESVGLEIPVTETKAYQLKKSALQENTNQSEGRFEKADAAGSQLAGLDVGGSTVKTKTAHKVASGASFLSGGEGSPLSRREDKRKPVANFKSRAFWGESDDSDSEIEAALRPRSLNTADDDFDDFYD